MADASAVVTPTRKAKWTLLNIIVVAYALTPVLWILSLSFKTSRTISDGHLIPREWTLENYRAIFSTTEFTRALVNSIGIALIDTILYGRSPIYGEDFRARLLAGDINAAQAIGLDPMLLINRPLGPPDEATVAFIRPLIERASLALTVNEAWAMLACVAIAGLLLVPFARAPASLQVPREAD